MNRFIILALNRFGFNTPGMEWTNRKVVVSFGKAGAKLNLTERQLTVGICGKTAAIIHSIRRVAPGWRQGLLVPRRPAAAGYDWCICQTRRHDVLLQMEPYTATDNIPGSGKHLCLFVFSMLRPNKNRRSRRSHNGSQRWAAFFRLNPASYTPELNSGIWKW